MRLEKTMEAMRFRVTSESSTPVSVDSITRAVELALLLAYESDNGRVGVWPDDPCFDSDIPLLLIDDFGDFFEDDSEHLFLSDDKLNVLHKVAVHWVEEYAEGAFEKARRDLTSMF